MLQKAQKLNPQKLTSLTVFPQKFIPSKYTCYTVATNTTYTLSPQIISPEQVLPDNESVLVLLWPVLDDLVDPIVLVPLFWGGL